MPDPIATVTIKVIETNPFRDIVRHPPWGPQGNSVVAVHADGRHLAEVAVVYAQSPDGTTDLSEQVIDHLTLALSLVYDPHTVR